MPSVSTQTAPERISVSLSSEPQITVTGTAKEFAALNAMAEDTYQRGLEQGGVDVYDNETRNNAGPLWLRIEEKLAALDEPKNWRRSGPSASPEAG